MKSLATIAAMTFAVTGPLAGCATTPRSDSAPAVQRDVVADAIIHIRGVT